MSAILRSLSFSRRNSRREKPPASPKEPEPRSLTPSSSCSGTDDEAASPPPLSPVVREPLEGLLFKRHSSKQLGKRWGSRYFVVDDARGILCYYKSEEATRKAEVPSKVFLLSELSGATILDGYETWSCDFELKFSGRFKFETTTTLLLQATNEVERQRWVDSLLERAAVHKEVGLSRRCLLRTGGRPLGITCSSQTVQHASRSKSGLRFGVSVSELVAGDAAADELQVGDVILDVGGQPIASRDHETAISKMEMIGRDEPMVELVVHRPRAAATMYPRGGDDSDGE